MGAFAPSVLLTPSVREAIERTIVRPVLAGLAMEGAPFIGFLYCGLMLTADGPKVIEFNCRFGDPEAQVVLPLLEGPLAPVLYAAATNGRLPPALTFGRDVAVGVVLASRGYPGPLDLGHAIHGLDDVSRSCPGVAVRFAGVAGKDGALVTSGGRVLTLVACAADYDVAIHRAYDAVERISFAGAQYRSDIGARALPRGAR
jgi:phosphoribosylamine--glycine ligase